MHRSFRPLRWTVPIDGSGWAPPSFDPINYLPLASVSLRDKYSRLNGAGRGARLRVTRNECLRGSRDRYRGNWKDFLPINFFSPSQLAMGYRRISKRSGQKFLPLYLFGGRKERGKRRLLLLRNRHELNFEIFDPPWKFRFSNFSAFSDFVR